MNRFENRVYRIIGTDYKSAPAKEICEYFGVNCQKNGIANAA
jgi:hypothetical protein